MSNQKWYRFEDIQYAAPLDEFDNPQGPGHLEVKLYEYNVLKETRCGVWLDTFMSKRFVLRKARKRFACPTIEQAAESFRARKTRQIFILSNQLQRPRRALELLEQYLSKTSGHTEMETLSMGSAQHAGSPS